MIGDVYCWTHPLKQEKRMPAKRLVTIAAIVIGLAALGGCGTDTSQSAAPSTTAGPSTTSLAPSPPKPTKLPTKTDLAIGVTILSKKCFGSAGCNVTYRIDPYYASRAGNIAPSQITYQVLGGSEGPQVNSFTMGSDGVALYEREESIRTGKSADVLTAEILQVLPR